MKDTMTDTERRAIEAQLNASQSIITARIRASRATVRLTSEQIRGVGR